MWLTIILITAMALLLLLLLLGLKQKNYLRSYIRIALLSAATAFLFMLIVLLDVSNNMSDAVTKSYKNGERNAYIRALQGYNPYCIEITNKQIEVNGKTITIRIDTIYTDRYRYFK